MHEHLEKVETGYLSGYMVGPPEGESGPLWVMAGAPQEEQPEEQQPQEEPGPPLAKPPPPRWSGIAGRKPGTASCKATW